MLCAVESRGSRRRGLDSEASIVYADGFHMPADRAAKLSGPAPVTRKLYSVSGILGNMAQLCNKLEASATVGLHLIIQ